MIAGIKNAVTDYRVPVTDNKPVVKLILVILIFLINLKFRCDFFVILFLFVLVNIVIILDIVFVKGSFFVSLLKIFIKKHVVQTQPKIN